MRKERKMRKIIQNGWGKKINKGDTYVGKEKRKLVDDKKNLEKVDSGGKQRIAIGKEVELTLPICNRALIFSHSDC